MISKAKRYKDNNPKKALRAFKGLLLYVLPFPILITAIFAFFKGDVSAIITSAISLGLFYLSATLARRGFKQEDLYHDSTLIKAPSLPYKSVAAVVLSIATFFTSYSATENSLILSLLLALSAFVGFFLYYGFDPRADKLGEMPLGVNADDLIEITQNARLRLTKLQTLKQSLPNFASKEHLQSIIMETEDIIDTVEQNPSDLSRSRKFFKIYLARTEAITQEFVNNISKGNIDDAMTENYNSLLKSVKETIKAQKEKLNDDDLLRLDVQIEALTKQIHHEGV